LYLLRSFWRSFRERSLQMNKKSKGNILLFLTAFIWGVAFVAQSVGMDYVGPFTFGFARYILGGLVLIPVIFLMEHREGKEGAEDRRTLFIGGICCGIALFAGSTLQQFGILYTTAGKAGFITALYIVIVPLLGAFMGKMAGKRLWISVFLVTAGMYFLCINESLRIGKGELLVFLCAFAFAGHILVIDHFSAKVNGVKMSCIQFFSCGIFSAVGMLLFEHPTLEAATGAWLPILYAGVLSSGVAYTLQIIGQKDTDPTVASLILSLESVFAVLAGWVILGQILSLKEIVGCICVFAGIILAQLPEKNKV